MAVRILNLKNNEDGQGIFEFIIFMPILIVTYLFIFRVGASINGSINQQKLTRRYFYYKVQNDSMTPRKDGLTVGQFQNFSLYFVGWRDRKEGESPVATCYKMTLPFSASRGGDDSCGKAYSGTSTSFIRVQTAYGVCGASYTDTGGNAMRIHNAPTNYSPNQLLSCANN